MRKRFLLCLAPCVLAACDASITDVGEIDADVLAQVARVSAGSATPAERVLVDLFGRMDSGRNDGATPVLPQLDSLFVLTLADPTPEFAERAASTGDYHEKLVRDAWSAIDAGDSENGERLLVDARDLQSDVVAGRLGKAGALGYIALVGRALDRARREADPDSDPRLTSMLDSALDLREDATRAVREDRLSDAFDLASHAAGLANALATGHVRD
jgi:hypothetical protein